MHSVERQDKDRVASLPFGYLPVLSNINLFRGLWFNCIPGMSVAIQCYHVLGTFLGVCLSVHTVYCDKMAVTMRIQMDLGGAISAKGQARLKVCHQ